MAVAVAATVLVSCVWWRAVALALAVLAIALRRTDDPHCERRSEQQYRGDCFLKGGEWHPTERSAAPIDLDAGTQLHLLLREYTCCN